jgi:hypothetical protein
MSEVGDASTILPEHECWDPFCQRFAAATVAD